MHVHAQREARGVTAEPPLHLHRVAVGRDAPRETEPDTTRCIQDRMPMSRVRVHPSGRAQNMELVSRLVNKEALPYVAAVTLAALLGGMIAAGAAGG